MIVLYAKSILSLVADRNDHGSALDAPVERTLRGYQVERHRTIVMEKAIVVI